MAFFNVNAIISLGLLGLAMKSLPVGTSYAVWVGVGAVGTAILGIVLLGAVLGAVGGALLGGAIDGRSGAGRGAVIGGVGGAVVGGASTSEHWRRMAMRLSTE